MKSIVKGISGFVIWAVLTSIFLAFMFGLAYVVQIGIAHLALTPF